MSAVDSAALVAFFEQMWWLGAMFGVIAGWWLRGVVEWGAERVADLVVAPKK